MGLDPVRFLVIQRILAATLLMPVLTAFSMLARRLRRRPRDARDGLPARPDLGAALRRPSHVRDVLVGRGQVARLRGDRRRASGACAGMQTKEGPNAVGDSTTRAVVAGILMIIVVDAIFAVLTYVLHI